MAYAHWAAAILHNGLGRYEEALAAACQASEDITAPHISMWALPELVEAAARAGQDGACLRCAQAAGGDHAALRQRFRARHRGALPGPAQR